MKANTKPDDFGLPKEVIERSKKLHQKGPGKPLEYRRQDILNARQKTRRSLSSWTIGLGAVAAILIGILYLQGIQKQDTQPQSYVGLDQEQWILGNYETYIETDVYVDDLQPQVDEMNWAWATKMEMPEEEIDLLIEKWSLEMTENEILNLNKL
jgi:hypothetical protein